LGAGGEVDFSFQKSQLWKRTVRDLRGESRGSAFGGVPNAREYWNLRVNIGKRFEVENYGSLGRRGI
jgi:hypothetical protein